MDQARKLDILSLKHPKYAGYLYMYKFGLIMNPSIIKKNQSKFVDIHRLGMEPDCSPPYYSVIDFDAEMKLLDFKATKFCISQSMNKSLTINDQYTRETHDNTMKHCIEAEQDKYCVQVPNPTSQEKSSCYIPEENFGHSGFAPCPADLLQVSLIVLMK